MRGLGQLGRRDGLDGALTPHEEPPVVQLDGALTEPGEVRPRRGRRRRGTGAAAHVLTSPSSSSFRPRSASRGLPVSSTQVPHCAIRHHSWRRLASVSRFRRRAPCGLVSRSGCSPGTSSQAAMVHRDRGEARTTFRPSRDWPPWPLDLGFFWDSRERGEEEKNGRMEEE